MLEFALLHQDYIHLLPNNCLPNRTPYFRLIHKHEQIEPTNLSSQFIVKNVDINTELALVTHVLEQCYPGIRISEQQVEKWTTHPVFSPDLWIWIIDQMKGVPAGLGIAELDQSIGEGSLEWIQVLPDYRGQGIGSAIVLSLLERLNGRSTFTTVAGEVNNLTKPENLYRRCGFTGDDIWWVLRAS